MIWSETANRITDNIETYGSFAITVSKIEIKAENQRASVWLIRDNNYILVKDDVDLIPYTTEEAGGFVGCTVGMYTSSNGEESNNNCDFSWLSVTELE